MPVKKATARKPSSTKKVTKGRTKVGDGYACRVCGLSVTVDEDCGCAEAHDIICCNTPMKKKRTGK